MVKLLTFSIIILSTTITIAQKIGHDTLFSISPKVFISTSKETESDSHYILALDYDATFYCNNIYTYTKNNIHYCHAHYSEDIKIDQEKYQKKIQQGVSIEKADSFILYKLTRFATHYHRNDLYYSWGVYDKLSKFDKLQGKYHYIDYQTAYKRKEPIYRKDYWKRDTEDSIYVYDCSIERYLLVDSVIYCFTSSLRKNCRKRNRKRSLRIVEREFKEFVRCIWVKEEEDMIDE
jgi:hypothetical protein